MDVWLLACMLFVFLSIFEFTVANAKRRKLLDESKKKDAAPESKISRRHPTNIFPAKTKETAFSGFLQQPSFSQPSRVTIRLRPSATLYPGLSVSEQIFPDLYNYPWVKAVPDPTRKDKASQRWNQLDMDEKAQYVFPIAFLLFNAIYWPVLFFRKF